jgi:NAD(P)-dependent dehydrogenase (short-subunit alcohol dehydrogenase family)
MLFVLGRSSLWTTPFHAMAYKSSSAVATPILANSGNDVSEAPLKEADSMDNALRRFGDPEEIAECLIWLTSGRASYVTATTLAANGGQIGV